MPTAAQRAKAEVTNTPDADGYDAVTLEGNSLQVKPVRQWRSSAVRALSDLNYDVWAQGCLSASSYRVWQSVDPTIEQCEEFFSAWTERTGQHKGESAAS